MAQRHDLTWHELLHMPHERGGIVDPLRPRVDVTALAVALTMASEVDRVSRHLEFRHAAREALVAARVFTQAVDDREGDRGVRYRPATVGEPGAVRRGQEAGAGGHTIRRQGGRSLSGS